MLSQTAPRDRTSRSTAEDLVLTTITNHAEALLRTARRHSICADDASDAYQRGLEIFLRNATRVDPAKAASWLHTVIKHEALAVRRSRQKHVAGEEFDGDALEAVHVPAPEERVLAFEDVTRAAEALQGLKPQEVQALWLRMEGRTYKEIAQQLGWTYTKVNRSVTEGRRAFIARYAGIESGDECRRLESSLSSFVDGELSAGEVGVLRRHLRGCRGCRATLAAMRSGDGSLRAVLPVALVVADPTGDSVLGVFLRIYETAAQFVQERAIALGAKAQFVVEASAAGKVAAVAGAAAVVAGSGAATVEHARSAPSPAPAARAAQPRSTSPAASAAVVAAIPATAVQAAKAAPIVIRRADPRSSERRAAPVTSEFAFERSPSKSQEAPTQREVPTSRPAKAGGEFDLEP
jgi:RNA polymerase sigma factor (sigma-70 family)